MRRALLLFANTLNIGADLGAMGEAAIIAAGIPTWGYVIVLASFASLAGYLFNTHATCPVENG